MDTLLTIAVTLCSAIATVSLWLAVRSKMLQRPGALPQVVKEERRHEGPEKRLLRAGLNSPDAIRAYHTAKNGALVVCIVGALSIIYVGGAKPIFGLLAMLTVVSGILGPRHWLDKRATDRETSASRDLPDLLDLLVVCLEAGLGFEQSLERIVHSDARHGLLSIELNSVATDLRLGVSVEQAFRRFAQRIGNEDLAALAALIARASGLGTPLAPLLRSHAKMVRQRSLLKLEERAGRSNATLALPLSLCLLPAAVLLMAGPAFVQLLEHL